MNSNFLITIDDEKTICVELITADEKVSANEYFCLINKRTKQFSVVKLTA